MGDSDIGVIGMAVMGQNIALNIESNGHRVSVYNRTGSTTESFYEERGTDKQIVPTYDLESFVDSLERPRKVLLMVKAGKPVDIFIDKLIPLLDEGDVIVDGGNSDFHDTERRIETAEDEGLLYLGTGISGGEYGALHGPSIMPGGHEEAYDIVGPLLEAAAAQVDGEPCCAYLGPHSAGHYVKMVHNGIEYAVMQSIAEAYWLMAQGLGMEPPEMSEKFADWNERVGAYLYEITADILKQKDDRGDGFLINSILDTAKQKGTGKWSVQSALDYGVPVPTMSAAVEGRFLSALKGERGEMGEQYGIDRPLEPLSEDILDDLEEALYISTVSSYAQGMKLLDVASDERGYDLDLSTVARVWKDGCIIRSTLLDPIRTAYDERPYPDNLMAASNFQPEYRDAIPALRRVLQAARAAALPVPAHSASLDYFESLTSPNLPANMIQAQRDCFGAHTYERRDADGTFHTEWGE
jgi:6-phosphogluconate dehydrogenase